MLTEINKLKEYKVETLLVINKQMFQKLQLFKYFITYTYFIYLFKVLHCLVTKRTKLLNLKPLFYTILVKNVSALKRLFEYRNLHVVANGAHFHWTNFLSFCLLKFFEQTVCLWWKKTSDDLDFILQIAVLLLKVLALLLCNFLYRSAGTIQALHQLLLFILYFLINKNSNGNLTKTKSEFRW